MIARELALFACVGFLAGGIDDLAIDLIYFFRRRRPRVLPSGQGPGRALAIFVPAWNEAGVIEHMLARAAHLIEYANYRIYVGCYPNDAATIAAVAAVAAGDPRIRLAINTIAGPTTKGDNLNSMWRALLRDEAADDWRADAIVLHDAEDVVHPSELTVFDRLLSANAVVQLPVVPLIAPNSRWVSAHYADEFAEVHSHGLAVREALGAGLPLAGVGCALRRDTIDRLASDRNGVPFDAASLVEDYELGLTIAAAGGRGCFAQIRDGRGELVCVRAYFPGTIAAAAKQKARWMAGIAFLGWDRLGWGRFAPLEYWMRMRDRRGPLAVVLLAAAYLALGTGAAAAALHLAVGTTPAAASPMLASLLTVNSALLVWRLAVRAWATGRIYGWREGVRSVPRIFVANFVALAAARRAFGIYAKALKGQAVRWDKTDHSFPIGVN